MGGPPSLAQRPQQPRRPKPKPKPTHTLPKAPSWEPGELPKSAYGDKGPTLGQVLDDAREGRLYFADLTDALQSWREVYHLEPEYRKLDQTVPDPYQGDLPVTLPQPATSASRTVGLTAPTFARLGFQCDPWAEDDRTIHAAQATENWARTFVEEMYRRYGRRATGGDFQPPMPRKMAGLAVVEGGYGWRLMPDPKAKDLTFPFEVEPIPLFELFARPRATTRQVPCRLGDAYTYPEVEKLLPPPDKDDTEPLYTEASACTLVTWTDETWWGMTVEFADSEIAKKVRERDGKTERWIYPPMKHNLGRRIYLVPNPWDATPLGPSDRDRTPKTRHLARGVFATQVESIKIVNQVAGALRSGVFKADDPPKKWTLDPSMRSQYPSVFTEARTQQMYTQAHQAGGNVVLGPNEDVEDIITSLAQSADGRAFMQLLMQNFADVAPPVLGGRGAAESGFDRFQANEAAGVLHVDPLIDYQTSSLEYLIEAALTDICRLSDGDEAIWDSLPYKVYRIKGKTTRGGFRSTLTAKDIKRSGPFVKVTFRDLNPTTRMALAQLHTMLVKEQFESRVTASDEMGIDDVEKERALMLAEAAVKDPAVVKAAIEVALQQQAAEDEEDEEGRPNWSAVFLGAFRKAQEQQAMAGGPPGEPGLPGMASPNKPPPAMPGSSAPGVPPVMRGM